MKRALNFSSGPAMLPADVLRQVAAETLDCAICKRGSVATAAKAGAQLVTQPAGRAATTAAWCIVAAAAAAHCALERLEAL